MRTRRVLTVLALMLVMIPTLAAAQVYRWVDEHGGVHYAGSLDVIPEKYRPSAAPVGMPAPTPGAPPASNAPASRPRTPPSGPLPSQTRIPPAGPAGYWEIAHPQGLLLKFADQPTCQEEAEKISRVFNRTVYCYARSD